MDEKYLEQAARLEQSPRDAAQHAAHRALAQPGQADCADCPAAIPAERRKAVPSAMRCVSCQQRFEFKKG